MCCQHVGKRTKTANINRIIQRKIKVDRRKSALSVKSKLKTELGLTISELIIRRRLYEIGFNGRVARKKSYVSKDNQVKRKRVLWKAAWILKWSSMVGWNKVKSIWIGWEGDDMAYSQGRDGSQMYRSDR